MMLPAVLDQIRRLAVVRGHAMLLARAAADLPGITATIDPAGVRLAGHQLHARVFGTRGRRRDPRLALFLAGRR